MASIKALYREIFNLHADRLQALENGTFDWDKTNAMMMTIFEQLDHDPFAAGLLVAVHGDLEARAGANNADVLKGLAVMVTGWWADAKADAKAEGGDGHADG